MYFCLFLLSCLSFQEDQATEDNWLTVKPENAGAAVRMPFEPIHRQRPFEAVRDQPSNIHMYLATTPDKKKSFVFAYHDLNEKIRDKKHEKTVLDGAVEGAKGPYLGDLIIHKEIVKEGNRGRDFTIIVNQNGSLIKIKQRVLLVKQRLYQLNVVCAQADFDELEASKFLDSFILEPSSGASKRPTQSQAADPGSQDK